MSSSIHDIQTYGFSADDALVLDTNIWLRVYGPQADPNNFLTKTYSWAVKQILTANSHIYIDASILSEFINAWARLEYNVILEDERPRNFKEYRNGAAFKPVAADIARAAQDIVSQCTRTETGFETVDISDLLKTFSGGDSDFNDLLLTELCKNRELKFVTHDADFKHSGLELLTANRRLLS